MHIKKSMIKITIFRFFHAKIYHEINLQSSLIIHQLFLQKSEKTLDFAYRVIYNVLCKAI